MNFKNFCKKIAKVSKPEMVHKEPKVLDFFVFCCQRIPELLDALVNKKVAAIRKVHLGGETLRLLVPKVANG